MKWKMVKICELSGNQYKMACIIYNQFHFILDTFTLYRKFLIMYVREIKFLEKTVSESTK